MMNVRWVLSVRPYLNKQAGGLLSSCRVVGYTSFFEDSINRIISCISASLR